MNICLRMVVSGFKALRLSFKCKDDEAAFLSWLETELLTPMFRALVVLAAGFIFHGTQELFYLKRDLPGEVNDCPLTVCGPKVLSISASFAFSLACGAVGTCIWVRRRWGRLASADLEASFVACMVFFGIMFSLANKQTSAELFRQDPLDVWGPRARHAVINVPLMGCLSLTYSCVFAPVRFHRMVLLAVLNMIALVVEYTLSNRFTEGGEYTVMLLIIMKCSLLRSAWSNEQRLRANWEMSRLAQANLQTVQQLSHEILQKEEEINEQREEIHEHMHGGLAELPGLVPVLPAQQRKASRGGSKLKPCPGAPNRAGNLSGALDGTWRCRHPPSGMADWLRYLSIKGPRVIDGEGRACLLRQAPDGSVILEGGALLIENGILVRTGKQSTFSFVRILEPDGEEDVDDGESDRESFFNGAEVW